MDSQILNHLSTCVGLVDSLTPDPTVNIHDTCLQLFQADEAEISKQIQDVGSNPEEVEPFLLQCSGNLTLTFFKLLASRKSFFRHLGYTTSLPVPQDLSKYTGTDKRYIRVLKNTFY